METPPTEQPPREIPARPGALRKLLVFTASLVAVLALVEGALRVRQYAKYGTFGQMHAFVVDPGSGLEIPPPGRTTANFSINARGFRGPLVETPKPAGRLRLAFLGASTTFCAEATSEAATWPALVAAGAAADRASGTVDYVNAGVGGHHLGQLLVNLEKRVAPLEPDVLFLYEATNDLTRDTRELALAQGVYSGHSDRGSRLGEYSLAWYLLEKNLLLGRRTEGAERSAARVRFVPAELSRGYRARLEALCDAAKARAKLVVLLTFCIQARRGQDPARLAEACNTSFYYMPYMSPELLLDGFDEYNRVAREVAAEKGVLLLDVSDVVPGDPRHFNDSVHFKDAGCAVFAAAILERLRADARWTELLRT